ncbi:hypothetical protein N7532_009930 [Penicillium argentinense]|uniref:Uncharacterized protein n=1 Tax=Penicillium argentinense TaxID=1131581 RepID=A0A9W9ENV2_9EURO|nr:uncharacterized protein N7532_009930 [Penicillium argentinense]KAJ5085159.1 hypothetical protein N7532_009930 [Penicillium argentinense]
MAALHTVAGQCPPSEVGVLELSTDHTQNNNWGRATNSRPYARPETLPGTQTPVEKGTTEEVPRGILNMSLEFAGGTHASKSRGGEDRRPRILGDPVKGVAMREGEGQQFGAWNDLPIQFSALRPQLRGGGLA